jgi:hypothetical protein
VTEKEILEVLQQMNSDKSPGPDGFSVHLYLISWKIIKNDLVCMIQYVQKSVRMGGNTNSSFLDLIPKEINPSSFSRFCPISLCNVSYNIISKIIENHIKPFLPSLISPNQGGFVEKRKMMDNILIVQEAIHSSRGKWERGMVIKIDMENAFDRVKHNFLFVVLARFGFGADILAWISSCISSPWISPMINGRPVNFFKISRGLRQGCPMSPLLYILMEESLSIMLEQAR